MKRILGWLLFVAMLLPGLAMGTQEAAPEVMAPGFAYYTLGTEASGLVRLRYDQTQVAGGLFILEDGYLSVGYAEEEGVIAPYPAGKPMTCLNSDVSVRWTLEDERLTGAWYTTLIELPDALVLGSERSPEDRGQIYSLMMIEKDTGAIRWQAEGQEMLEKPGLVWIGAYRADANGNILVGSNGDLRGGVDGAGTLTLLSAADGSVLWAAEYQTGYGMDRVSDICPLGEGWLISGWREEERIILYADAEGTAQGYFTFRPWGEGYDYTSLFLMPVSEDVAYLAGWEMEGAVHDDYRNRTLWMMRITEETFSHDNKR